MSELLLYNAFAPNEAYICLVTSIINNVNGQMKILGVCEVEILNIILTHRDIGFSDFVHRPDFS
jgi:hypothetical protein